MNYYTENMKRLLTLLACFFCINIGVFAARQDETVLRGSLVDASGDPVGFATAYLSSADGRVVSGVTTGEDGRFELRAASGAYTLTVSLVGYRDASQPVSLKGAVVELPPIVLQEDAQMLEGASVQAIMPKTKLTGEGLATSVHGSVLENVGSANDVLGKVPGLIKGQNGIEVIGAGAPVIYINGRKLTDATELDRLLSNEIQSVEVITNPGAQYDATIRAVVRIKTIRRQGDGFGFNVSLTDEQSLQKKENNDREGMLNVNYRTGGVDFFAGGIAANFSNFQRSDLEQETLGQHDFRQVETLTYDLENQSVGLNGGLNWQISDNHFTGFKLDWNQYHDYREHTLMEGDIFLDGALLDHLRTDSDGSFGGRKPSSLAANAYYNGTAGKLGIDLNLDYYTSTSYMTSRSREDSVIEDADVSSDSASQNKLYAAKLVFSYPVWKGMLQVGTEETFSRISDSYTVQGATLPSSNSRVREDNIAGFVNYGFVLGRLGQLSAGLRYEHVNYAYDDLLGTGSFARKYDNLFPSVSFAGVIGSVQTMLSYSAKTSRPVFSQLSNAIRYNNRYTLQSGNAALQPQIINTFTATALWKFLVFNASYIHLDNYFTTWARPYNDEGVIMLKPENLDQSADGLTVSVTATPTIGPWNLSYTVGVQQQWMKVGELDFSNKPLWIAQLNNTFTFDKGWQIELGGEYHSPGYSYVAQVTNHYLNLSAAVQKTLLKDGSLVLRIEGNDLANLGHHNVFSNLGNYRLTQSILMDTQRLVFSVRYRFNTAQSKYKGTGAGTDARDRMK